jgi:hypothetical protein
MPPATDDRPNALYKSYRLYDLFEEGPVTRLIHRVVECLEEGRNAQDAREKEDRNDVLVVQIVYSFMKHSQGLRL